MGSLHICSTAKCRFAGNIQHSRQDQLHVVFVVAADFPPSLPNQNDHKDDQDVRWSTSATTVERVREQTHLSLTERLRREFGLCEDESEEDEDKKAGM